MSSLSFPDINLWLALAAPEHVHSVTARHWWRQEEGNIAFSRLSQLGLLRLVTTSSAMDGKPLTVSQAWRAYDRFFDDDRVVFIAEPPNFEKQFREMAAGRTASPKIWSDAWLLAFARATEGTLVTFDRALASRGAHCLLETKRA